jgi:mono/diheme cytochrome c family protein
MKSIITMLPILSIVILLSFCTGNKAKIEQATVQTAELSQEELIAKGEYLVTIGGCNDCHSPKQMTEKGPEIIKELMLSGYPADRPLLVADKNAITKGWALMNYDLTQAAGPWGVSFAANLTPDPTGIGNWTEEQFKKALTQGKFKGMDGGRMLLPPMPWFNFAYLKDEDVSAIYAYLKSIKPVNNLVPAPISPEELK